MRILKVSFCNLNSLAGQWEIDFEDPDFDLNGLFLITGPTGAGKTTLLDAISLALYGQTPRLDASGSQNEIMTRHTNNCWSEVLFETENGRYRARWEQRRKRNGEPDSPRRELARADGEIIAEKTRDADKAVTVLTGLDFSQFRRAILLAQGEFSAFLRAKDDEKSAILEKITDTSIYSRLSKFAYEKAKEEEGKRLSLEKEIAELPTLDPELEREKRERLAACESQLAALADAIRKCDDSLKWLANIAALKKEAALLESGMREFGAKMERFEPDRLAMLSARAASVFEADYQAMLMIDENLKKTGAELERVEREQKTLGAQLVASTQRAGEFKKEFLDAQKTLEDARGPLAEARRLDRELSEKGAERAKRLADIKEREARLQEKSSALDAKRDEDARLEKSLAGLELWFSDNAHDAWLLDNWGELKEKIKIQKAQWARIADVERDSAKESENLEKTRAQIATESGKLKREREFAAECGAALRDLEVHQKELLAGFTIAGLERALKDKRLAKSAADLIKKLEDHPKELKDGEPCPLCGALDHPFATGGAPDPSVLEIQIRETEMQINEARANEERMRAKNEEKTKAESAAKVIEERLAGFADKEKLIQASRERLAREAADLRRAALENDNQIAAALAPLGLDRPGASEDAIALLDGRLNDWRHKEKERAEAKEARARLSAELAALETEKAGMAQALSEKRNEDAALAGELAALKEQRKALFEGRDADAIEKALKADLSGKEKALEKAEGDMRLAEAALEKTNGAALKLNQQIVDLGRDLENAANQFGLKLAEKSWNMDDFLAARRERREIEAWERTERELSEEKTRLETRVATNAKKLAEEEALRLTDKTADDLSAESAQLLAAQAAGQEERAALRLELRQNQESAAKASQLAALLEAQSVECRKWSDINDLIGSADGKKFRSFAQNITLDLLLERANAQLAKITDRYNLIRRDARGASESRKKYLEIAVVDNYQAGEIRGIENLSGGETFVASLALALGLSELAGRQAALGSLFLDEGFGTLDSETLETAIDAISSLRAEGKLIGIISHVEALKERIGTRITVRPRELGRSEIIGPGCSEIR